MNSEAITIGGAPFLKVEMHPVRQKGKEFFICTIPYQYLIDIYTVEPAEYRIFREIDMAHSFESDQDHLAALVDEGRRKADQLRNQFQRTHDTGRVNKIATWLIEKEYAFFPNTIIASCAVLFRQDLGGRSDVPLETLLEQTRQQFAYTAYVEMNSESKYTIYIPRQLGALLVIDGQHRIRGLAKAHEEITAIDKLQQYDVLVSLLLDLDSSVLAEQFYTINSTQTSVNPSLLYQLMGEFSADLNEIAFLHEVIKLMNEREESPFYRRVKMLGKIPNDESELGARTRYSISQAFLMDYLKPTIEFKKSNKGVSQPIFRVYFRQKERQIEVIRYLLRFFNAVRTLLPEWEDPQASLLSKGMGIAALVQVMQMIFLIRHKEAGDKRDNVIRSSPEEHLNSLQGIERLNLSQFQGQGSAGSIGRIRAEMVRCIRIFDFQGGDDEYRAFVSEFKTEYVGSFRNWLAAQGGIY